MLRLDKTNNDLKANVWYTSLEYKMYLNQIVTLPNDLLYLCEQCWFPNSALKLIFNINYP